LPQRAGGGVAADQVVADKVGGGQDIARHLRLRRGIVGERNLRGGGLNVRLRSRVGRARDLLACCCASEACSAATVAWR